MSVDAGCGVRCTRTAKPSALPSSATASAWFDPVPPDVISVRLPCACASPRYSSSFRTLPPPKRRTSSGAAADDRDRVKSSSRLIQSEPSLTSEVAWSMADGKLPSAIRGRLLASAG